MKEYFILLYLLNNQITDHGCRHIVAFVQRSNALAYLDVGGNNFSEIGIMRIFEMFSHNKSITRIGAFFMQINKECMARLVEILKHENTTLKKIDIDTPMEPVVLNSLEELFEARKDIVFEYHTQILSRITWINSDEFKNKISSS